MNMLEWELIVNKIDYRCEEWNKFGLDTPYLIVDGVPLDFDRAIKWIKECHTHE